MKLFNLCALFLIAHSSFGATSPSAQTFAGTWRLSLSPDLKVAAQKLGVPEPTAEVVLKDDGSFSSTQSSASGVFGCRGQFEVHDNYLVLNADKEFPVQKTRTLKADVESPNAIVIDGMRYVRGGNFSVEGSWTLQRGDSEEKSIRFEFRKNGTFVFSGPGYGSAGKYTCDGGSFTLIWTEVDGEKVEEGSMRKTIQLGPDGFQVDTYRYARKG